ncbi:LysR substrate-binding domain-containing protein [Ruegeria aquimaris]|uniref:LysR substrate-binding domain-containing protein n=1 Tax=Ruegeria aquimaris TaxID=2984333 RepID=A0ABT3AKC6_9RHOB|nr:LysR substrate-binding domain-containing protein [Ruegeria sp. XHP0148]MCV2889130.1 LysR substrate-binding domain-containing protein [Ruegeria sp. XHP0148]
MPALPHVTWLKSFEAAARHSSFSSAAAELNLTPAAVSQQIRLLEQHLKAQLFQRLPRGVKLTDIGLAYAQTIRKSFDEMAVATDGLFGKQRKREVRVRAAISSATLVIAPHLAEFQTAHPDIIVRFVTSIWADRFDLYNLDLDIRWGLGTWDEPLVQHLGHESAVPVCSPAFAAALGGAPDIAALARSQVVQIIGSETDWRKLSDLHGLGLGPTADWMFVDSSLSALQIVSAGTGVTMVLESFARPYLERSELIVPVECKLPKRRAHYLVTRDEAAQRDEVRQFAAWVTGLYRDLLSE